MIYRFSIAIDADCLKEKFLEKTSDNPHFGMELVKGFSQCLVLGLGLKPSDEYKIADFKIEEIQASDETTQDLPRSTELN